ncbi:hypothetical protein BYT27DRAFT_7182882 [Phlegmacium glaucopus]|nr:hypothetical protein BYT27DRAFT_7182882 [Phlegmacium glaucopus]
MTTSESSNKRLCESSLASLPTSQQSNIDPHLTNRLRNLGSRVRKDVSEGYKTSPSSFSKAQSTGSIFRSMNDIFRDVYSNMPVDSTNQSTTGKRSRSLSPLISPDADMLLDENDQSMSPVETTNPSRPIKPLRRSRHSLLETRSLPNGPLLFGNSDHTPDHIATKTIDEEDDWSNQKADEDFEQPFEPMVL